MFKQQETITWQVIAKRLVIKNEIKTAITVFRLNKVNVDQYQQAFDEYSKLPKGIDRMDKEDTLAAKMLSDLRS